jgi:hypothetical protein
MNSLSATAKQIVSGSHPLGSLSLISLLDISKSLIVQLCWVSDLLFEDDCSL